jgi:hypothetical protein
LDVVDYVSDNWLRCWFAGIQAKSVSIDRHKDVRAWEAFIRRLFTELSRIVRVGGIVAFEVGEVRGGKILLERHVVNAVTGLPFKVLGVMLNQQDFTKTSNCWGVSNNAKARTRTGSCLPNEPASRSTAFHKWTGEPADRCRAVSPATKKDASRREPAERRVA